MDIVRYGLDKPVTVAKEFARQKARVRELGARFEGAIVARMATRAVKALEADSTDG